MTGVTIIQGGLSQGRGFDSRSGNSRFPLLLLRVRHYVVNVVLGAEENGRSLVNALGNDVQNINVPIRCQTTGFLHYEGHRDALVEKPQLKSTMCSESGPRDTRLR